MFQANRKRYFFRKKKKTKRKKKRVKEPILIHVLFVNCCAVWTALHNRDHWMKGAPTDIGALIHPTTTVL